MFFENNQKISISISKSQTLIFNYYIIVIDDSLLSNKKSWYISIKNIPTHFLSFLN